VHVTKEDQRATEVAQARAKKEMDTAALVIEEEKQNYISQKEALKEK